MSALSSSSSPFRQRRLKYGIFLSFCGKDTRTSFTDHLHSALTRNGIETFRDDKSLERGEDFAPELLRAIGESWGSIIVFSKEYVFSHWCLDELVEIMKQREEWGHRVYPIFYYVEPSDFRHQKHTVKKAFKEHEKKYNKEMTQRWRLALKQVTGISGWPLKHQHESVFIEDIVKEISEKLDAEFVDEREVEKVKSTYRTIQAMLVDAENKQNMKKLGEAAKVWFDKLKHIAYDIDDVLDDWNTAILKSKIERDRQAQTPSTSSSLPSEVHNIPSTFFGFGGIALRHDIALRIKELNKKLDAITREKHEFSINVDLNCYTDLRLERPKTISLIDESVVFGRDHDMNGLIHLLLSDNNGEGRSGNGIPLVAIVGMGGLGKTTLAQLAYNNDRVKEHFPLRIWVCVSDPFDELGIAKIIIEALTGTPSKFNDLERLSQEICQNVEGKKFLLVLDDVWNEDEKKWEPLKLSLSFGSKGSKILVTTRKEKVASVMGCTRPFSLGVLSNEDSWSLFSNIAFFERSNEDCENLESIGRMMVDKCAGLPLAIKTVASLLRFKRSREQWQSILNSHVWEIDEAEKGLFSPLLLSYYDLPAPLRQCFSYCAIFPKDYMIEKDLLIKLWMAQGYLGERQESEMEIVGEEYFDNLATRSFFQEFEKNVYDEILGCKMHDIVHDFAQFLRSAECFVVLACNGIEEPRGSFYDENVRHLTLIRDHKYKGIPDPIYNLRKLRNLFLVDSSTYHGSNILDACLPKLFDQLTCLRMLDLSGNKSDLLEELPQEMGKLIHLRYLSLEGNSGLIELPEAVCDLYNLQTLNIKSCFRLNKLPHGLEKLINLRHLHNEGTDSIVFMPKGMERLTSLRTLEVFVLNKGGRISSLKDLGKLIHLRRKLWIRGLGNVRDVSEAREAQISTKAGLAQLILWFDGDENDWLYADYWEQSKMVKVEALLLQALHPPPNLRHLGIGCIRGTVFPFPDWMMSLTLLKGVELYYCDNLVSLPPMGKLPFLESLTIHQMMNVTRVAEEFLGVETEEGQTSQNVAFPNLKQLVIVEMYEWKWWEYYDYEKVALSSSGVGGDSSSSSSSSPSSNIPIIMPKLECLFIDNCTKLRTLPRHLLQSTSLQKLIIDTCPILGKRFNKETGHEWPSISHIPDVEIVAYE